MFPLVFLQFLTINTSSYRNLPLPRTIRATCLDHPQIWCTNIGVWIWIHKIKLQFRCRGHYDGSRQSHQARVQWLINYKGTRCSLSFHMQSHWIALQEREGSYSLLVALISLVARAAEMFWCPQQRVICFWKGIAQQCSEHHWRPRWHSLQLSVPWHP